MSVSLSLCVCKIRCGEVSTNCCLTSAGAEETVWTGAAITLHTHTSGQRTLLCVCVCARNLSPERSINTQHQTSSDTHKGLADEFPSLIKYTQVECARK